MTSRAVCWLNGPDGRVSLPLQLGLILDRLERRLDMTVTIGTLVTTLQEAGSKSTGRRAELMVRAKVCHLRRHLLAIDSPYRILSHHGLGYRLIKRDPPPALRPAASFLASAA